MPTVDRQPAVRIATAEPRPLRAAAGKSKSTRRDTPRETNSPVAIAKSSRAHTPLRRYRGRLAILAGVAILSVGFWVAWQPLHHLVSGAPIQPAIPTHAPIPAAVQFAAPGLVRPASGALQLTCEVSGTIVAMPVKEGDAVQAGQVIAELDHREHQARVAAAEAVLATAQAEIERLKIDLNQQVEAGRQQAERLDSAWKQVQKGPRPEVIEAQTAVLKAAELEAERLEARRQRQQNAGMITEQDQTDLQKWAERARQQVAVERAGLERLTRGATAEELQQAAAANLAAQAEYRRLADTKPLILAQAIQTMQQRQAELTVARTNLEKTWLRAPRAGAILWQYLHVGESVSSLAPQPVVLLADLTQLEIRADVDEADFPRVFPGQTVEIRCDAYRGRSFTGQVVRLNRVAGQKHFRTGEVGERNDIRVIEAVIRIDRPESFVVHQRVTVYFIGTQPADRITSPIQQDAHPNE